MHALIITVTNVLIFFNNIIDAYYNTFIIDSYKDYFAILEVNDKFLNTVTLGPVLCDFLLAVITNGEL